MKTALRPDSSQSPERRTAVVPSNNENVPSALICRLAYPVAESFVGALRCLAFVACKVGLENRGECKHTQENRAAKPCSEWTESL